MEFRNLGRSGLRVSAVGLGCNNFGGRSDPETSRKVIHKALDCGITLFDTADVYGERGGSETILGQTLGDRRKDIVLATKFGMAMDDEGARKGAARRYIMRAAEDSLRRLKTDYIDLFQQHRMDPLTPIEETLRALDDLIRQGKVRYIGCSNFSAWRVAEARGAAALLGANTFVSCQDEYSLLVAGGTERELIPAMKAFGIGLLPFYPLAGGLLTGKYRRGEPPPAGTRLSQPSRFRDLYLTDDVFDLVAALEGFALARGRSLLELSMSWLACTEPVASVIAGASRPEQVEANVATAQWKLTREEMEEVAAIRARAIAVPARV